MHEMFEEKKDLFKLRAAGVGVGYQVIIISTGIGIANGASTTSCRDGVRYSLPGVENGTQHQGRVQ